MNTDKAYAEKIVGEYAPKEARKVAALKRGSTAARGDPRTSSRTSSVRPRHCCSASGCAFR